MIYHIRVCGIKYICHVTAITVKESRIFPFQNSDYISLQYINLQYLHCVLGIYVRMLKKPSHQIRSAWEGT
jgi:hypothetical protein